MDLNRLAVLVDRLGGVDVVAQELNVDEDILQFALQGNRLNQRQSANIDNQLFEFLEDEERREYYEIDNARDFGLDEQGFQLLTRLGFPDTYTGFSDKLETIGKRMDDVQRFNSFRSAFVNEQVDIDDFDSLILLFSDGSSTRNIHDKLVSWLIADENRNAKEFVQLFRNDDERLDEMVGSYFWEWFRDTFYGDD